jgi:hypothetical protein
MSTSAVKADANAVDVTVRDDQLVVVLADGRDLAAPLAWFPRLPDAAPDQRRNWRLIGRGQGIHWPDVRYLGREPAAGRLSQRRR